MLTSRPVHHGPFVDSSGILDDPEQLRTRALTDGYLFVRGLLPPELVLDVRRQVLECLDEFGWLDRGEPLDAGILDSAAVDQIDAADLREDIGISHDAYLRVQQIREMHALPHHPNLLGLYEGLLATPVFVHPRHVVRVMTGHSALRPTPAHQDYPHIQGTPHTWTCWIPLGRCGLDIGPLTVWEASHTGGYRPVVEAAGAGGIAVQTCDDEAAPEVWRQGGFEPGDVLTFTSLTVHRALPATRRDRVRLSMDVRYQSVDEPIEAKSLGNHLERPWDDVYEQWAHDDPLRHYWRGSEPPLDDWDESLTRPSRRIC